MLFMIVVLLTSVSSGSTLCPQGELAIYKVTMETDWSLEKFPKHYPSWRPRAQWSKVLGCTHNQSFRLWKLGDLASEGLKLFAETGNSNNLVDHLSQGRGGIFDVFSAPAVFTGVGTTEGTVFLDGNHSKVSLISKIIPSPDWFVGVDSLELCPKGEWVEQARIGVGPVDAGTDAGFTFTSPNWELKPRLKISQITAHHPSHPANSFYYPALRKLPPLATFKFVKVNLYNLTIDVMNTQSVKQETVNQETNDDNQGAVKVIDLSNDNSQNIIEKSVETISRNVPNLQLSDEPKTTKLLKDKGMKKRKKKLLFKELRQNRPRPCKVSEWSNWSACSKSCGFGQMTKIRKIIKSPKRGGKPCPNLVATRWCGSARNCRPLGAGYFMW
ncbi:spondin-2-like [Limulus polyphemus]|uniref:Spondin-2-like n=1 Tax=Limulus polyphemus TaxID=6850 RepID=A0ABM1BYZ4_LIMPO|nr:spondin-2-like [Limulus polyphemus]